MKGTLLCPQEPTRGLGDVLVQLDGVFFVETSVSPTPEVLRGPGFR